MMLPTCRPYTDVSVPAGCVEQLFKGKEVVRRNLTPSATTYTASLGQGGTFAGRKVGRSQSMQRYESTRGSRRFACADDCSAQPLQACCIDQMLFGKCQCQCLADSRMATPTFNANCRSLSTDHLLAGCGCSTSQYFSRPFCRPVRFHDFSSTNQPHNIMNNSNPSFRRAAVSLH